MRVLQLVQNFLKKVWKNSETKKGGKMSATNIFIHQKRCEMAPPDKDFVFGEVGYDAVTLQDLISARIKDVSDVGKLGVYLQVFSRLTQQVESRLQQLKGVKTIEFQQSTIKEEQTKKKRLAGSIGNSRATPRANALQNRINFLKSASLGNTSMRNSIKHQKTLNEVLNMGATISLSKIEPHSKLETDLKQLENYSSFLRDLRKFKEKSLEEFKKASNLPISSIWMNCFYRYAEENSIGRVNLSDNQQRITIQPGNFDDIFLPSITLPLVNSLTNYLSIQHELKTEKNVGITMEVLDFYKRFRVDPYSTLVGFSPSRKVISQITPITNQNKLTRGSLLIAKFNHNNNNNNNNSSDDFVFCRYISRVVNKIDVIINLNKNTTSFVELSDCYELSDELENEIINCEFSKTNKFIEYHFDEFYRNLMFVDVYFSF